MKSYKTSKERWTIDPKNTIYSQKRDEHHKEIIRDSFIYNKKELKKRVYIVGGGSGAGKSKFIKDVLEDIMHQENLSFQVINPDLIKPNILDFIEWKTMMEDPEIAITIDCDNPSDFVHEESSDIAKMMIDEAIDNNFTFIYDGTFKNKKRYRDLLIDLERAGYEVDIFLINVELDVALKRVEARNEKNRDGKHVVPKHIVELSNKKVAQTFLELKNEGILPSYSIFDNSKNGEGVELIAYFNKQEGEKIVRADLYQKFIEKGRTI